MTVALAEAAATRSTASQAVLAAAAPAETLKGPPASPRAARLSPHEQSSVVKLVAPATDAGAEPEDEAAVAQPVSLEDAPPPALDEAAEASFLAEARERGEVVAPRKPAEAEEAEPKALPPLDALVQQIPGEVRETLEELFRARFVTVKRFPKKALKA